jgi:hypothetical protein
MSVLTHVRNAALVALSAAISATIIGSPAQAAPDEAAASSVSVSLGRLVLEPGPRGYTGSLRVTAKYQGDEPAYLNLSITEPVDGSFVGLDPIEACVFGTNDAGRRVVECGFPGERFEPGERRQVTVDFGVLTQPQAYAMASAAGQITVRSGSEPAASDTGSFVALFRSTAGSLRHPRPYVQDTTTDLTVTAGAAALVRQDDGTFAGRATVTVRYGTDAAHYQVGLEVTLPDGVRFDGVEPPEACGGLSCVVPGGPLMQGEVRTFGVLLSAPAGTVAGPLGSGGLAVDAHWGSTTHPDVDPADNTAAFAVTAVDAG